ncbi:hypothetical protein FACS18949_02540 [Clostridia bacterium]|nr:hypothetical protein FACS18949_02540 [Clostridia bacterium]
MRRRLLAAALILLAALSACHFGEPPDGASPSENPLPPSTSVSIEPSADPSQSPSVEISPSPSQPPEVLPSAKEIVDAALTAVRKNNIPEIEKYLNYYELTGYVGDELKAGSPEQLLAAALFKPLTWIIGKEEADAVSVSITTVDNYSVANQFTVDYINLVKENEAFPENDRYSEEQMKQRQVELLCNIISQTKETSTSIVSVSVVTDGGSKRIKMTDALNNALTGNLFNASREQS